MSTRDLLLAASTGTNNTNKIYVDDVFSTYLYTGNGGTQAINNSIDLSGQGGMVWIKCRNQGYGHIIFDTNRGFGKYLSTHTNDKENYAGDLGWGTGSFGNSGFTVVNGGNASLNSSSNTFASWTFRKNPKFFDMVTYTGDGVVGRQIPHNLGTNIGMAIVKRIDVADHWYVVHRSRNNIFLKLNSTDAESASPPFYVDVANFLYLQTPSMVNASGATYVAYIFAHDDSADGIIQCGSYVGNGSANGPEINLGWEPQFLLMKSSSYAGGNWVIEDSMRGFGENSGEYILPQTTDLAGSQLNFTAKSNGFKVTTNNLLNSAGQTYIYLAIRRPNKPPTSGSQVFHAGSIPTGSNSTWTTPMTVDMVIPVERAGATYNYYLSDRLRGANYLQTSATATEAVAPIAFDVQLGLRTTGAWYTNGNFGWFFKRAPGFFDVVCYVGDGTTSTRNIKHNLAATPELMIFKVRNGGTPTYSGWTVNYGPPEAASLWGSSGGGLHTNAAANLRNYNAGAGRWNTNTVEVYGGTLGYTNDANVKYVVYLFASLPGVSKVGSYTGNGTSQTINCGFTTGARFILIKRSDNTGDWYIWDSTRGIIAANDPHLSLNSTAAEVATDDSIDPDTSGFIVNQNAATNINVTGSSYIFLSIA